MDSDSWSRISSYSRRLRSRSADCSEDFDVVGLCCHIDKEHAIEANNGVCPVCAKRVGSDLIRHLTVQHTSLLKVQRRRLRKGRSNIPLSFFRRELRDGNLHSLLGGSSIQVMKSNPLLTSFICSPPVDGEISDPQTLSSVEGCSMADNIADNSVDRVVQNCPLSDEDVMEKTQKCEFVQGILMSTFGDDF